MNSPLIPIIFFVVGTLEIVAAFYIWFLGARQAVSRAVAALLGLFAINSLLLAALGNTISSADARPWLMLFTAFTYPIGPAVYLISVFLLRPAWLRHRWLYGPILVYALLPFLAVLLDWVGLSTLVLNQPLLYTGPDPLTYSGGVVPLGEISGGLLRNFLRVGVFAFPILAMICPMGVVAWVDRKKQPAISQFALLLFGATLTASISQVLLTNLISILWSTLISNLVFFTGFLIAAVRRSQIEFNVRVLLKSFRNISVFAKLILIIVTVVLPTILIVTLATLTVFQRDTLQQVGGSLHGLAESEAKGFGNQLLAELANLQRLRSASPLRASIRLQNGDYLDREPAEIRVALEDLDRQWHTEGEGSMLAEHVLTGFLSARSELRQFQENFPAYSQMMVVDQFGAVVTAIQQPADYLYADEAWFQSLFGPEARMYVSEELAQDENGDTYVEFALPIFSEDEGSSVVIGALYSRFGIVRILEQLEGMQDGVVAQEQIHLFDAGGDLVALEHDLAEGVTIPLSWNPPAESENLWTVAAFGEDVNVVSWSTIGENIPGSQLEGIPWRIVVNLESEAALTSIVFARRVAAITTLNALVFAVLATAGLARLITSPLEDLTRVAEQVSQGDFNAMADASARDEIGNLATSFNSMTTQLRDLIGGLEEQVQDRTQALAQRATQLQTASEVGRAASSILNVDELITTVVDLIRDRFDLYYVGLFLVDESSLWAVLRAGTGSAGEILRARRHRIRLGEGMIGWAIQNAALRVAQEAEADSVRLTTPELPETRSEAALPLRARGTVIGAVSVQSRIAMAFDRETLNILQAMCDQVAIAIDNAGLLAENQKSLAETQSALETVRRTYSNLSAEAWGTLARQEPEWGRLSAGEAVETGQSSLPVVSADQNQLRIPVRIRDYVAGTIRVRKANQDSDWTPEEINLMEAYTNQLGLALESARLFQDTRRRSIQLATSAEIAQAANSQLDLNQLLPTAVNLIADRFNLYYVGVFLNDPEGHWAVLQAGTGEPGRIQIERSHRLEVGGESMIGQAIAKAEPRVALDVGAEAVRFDNPYLPETRSEMALPLTTRGQIIGALTIQSRQPAAFGIEDLAVLQTMADQLAIAIQNARLYQQTQDLLEITRQRGRVLEQLVQATQKMTSIVTQAEMRRLIVDEIIQALVPDQVNFYEWVPDQESFHIYLRLTPGGQEDDYSEGQRVPAAKREDLRQVFETGEPRYEAELRADQLTHERYCTTWSLGAERKGVIEIFHTARGAHIRPEDRELIEGIVREAAVALQSAQLYERTQELLELARQRGRVLEQLVNASSAMVRMVSEAEMRQLVVEEVNKVVFPDQINLYEWDPLRSGFRLEIRFVPEAEGEDQYSIGQTIPVDERPDLLKVFEGGQDLYTAELRADGMTHERFCTVWSIGNQRLGVIELYHTARDASIRQEDRDVITGILQQAAVALQSARSFEQTQRTLARTEALFQVSQAAIGVEELSVLLQAVVDRIAETLPADQVVLFTLDTRNERVLQVIRNGSEEATLPVDFPDIMKGITGRVIRDREPTLVPARRRQSRQNGAARAGQKAQPHGSQILVPLVYRAEVLGLLVVANRLDHKEFDQEDTELIAAMGNQAAAAIQNANLLAETQNRAESERMLNQISSQFTRSLDLKEVLRTAAAEIARLPNIRQVVLRMGKQPSPSPDDGNGKTKDGQPE